MISKVRHSVLLAALFATGCASVGGTTVDLAALECAQYDCAKMHAISEQGRLTGVKVVWINPPQKQQLARNGK